MSEENLETAKAAERAAGAVSEANEQMIRSMYAAFSEIATGRKIASYVATYYEADAVYEPVEEAGAIRGHAALVGWHERWFDAWETFHAAPDEVIAVDDVVFATVSVRGRGDESGTEVDQRFFHVTEVRNGRIGRIREYLERGEALAAAGLSPASNRVARR